MAKEKRIEPTDTGESIIKEPTTREPVVADPLISFNEFSGGASFSAILLAGARIVLMKDGMPRKHTQAEWARLVQLFSDSPSL